MVKQQYPSSDPGRFDSSLDENITLISTLYTKKNPHNYHAYQELQKYDVSVPLISCIVYKPKNSSEVLNTDYYITFSEDKFSITNTYSTTLDACIFDPVPYLGASSEQLIAVSNESLRYLLYFPPAKYVSDAMLFFILDTKEIKQRMESIMTDELIAIALIDADQQLAVDVNGSLLMPH